MLESQWVLLSFVLLILCVLLGGAVILRDPAKRQSYLPRGPRRQKRIQYLLQMECNTHPRNMRTMSLQELAHLLHHGYVEMGLWGEADGLQRIVPKLTEKGRSFLRNAGN